jgi:hypothetical protein
METALKTSGQPVRRGTIAHDHEVYTALADMAARQRDPAGLRQYAPVAAQLAERDEHALYLAVAQRSLGVAARLAGGAGLAESEALLVRALDGFRRLGARWQAGRTLCELGELALAQSDPAEARAHFSEALAEFEALQAAPDAERARKALDSLG